MALPIESQTLQKLHTIRHGRTYNEEEGGPLIPHHNNTSNTYHLRIGVASQHLRKSNLHQAIRWGERLHLWDKIYPNSSYHFFKPIPRIIITTTIRSRHDLDPSTVSHFNFIYEPSIVSIFCPLFFKLIQYYPYYVLLSPCKQQLQMSSYLSFFLYANVFLIVTVLLTQYDKSQQQLQYWRRWHHMTRMWHDINNNLKWATCQSGYFSYFVRPAMS